jgi:hypothetical protein
MNEVRKRADWPIIAALVLGAVLAATAIYVGCYFAMTKEVNEAGYKTTYRIFSHEWKASLFRAGARIESWWEGHTVEAIGPPDPSIWLDLDYKMGGSDLPSMPLPLAEDFVAEATAREFSVWEFIDDFGMLVAQERDGWR